MKPVTRRFDSFVIYALVVCAAGMSASASAKDLGIIGPTYPISEPHLLQMIAQRLQEKARSGELQRYENEARSRTIQTVNAPPPVAGLHPTTKARTFYFDPTFTLDRNVLGPKGELLFTAGLRKNPLEIVSLSRRLLFFDARDKHQVQRAKQLMTTSPGRIKPILVGGSYLDLMKAWQVPVYYDQDGQLTRRLGISQVPALVSQEGLRLRIDELELVP